MNAAQVALNAAEVVAAAKYGSLSAAYKANDNDYMSAKEASRVADEAFSIALRADMDAQKTDRIGQMVSFNRRCY